MRLGRFLAVVLLVLTGCSAPESEPQAADSTCGGVGGFLCLTLQVPLDHARPEGPKLDLAVAAAQNDDAPRGVLLVLTGGPGQPGVPLLKLVHSELDQEILEQYRVVVYDQRGTGKTGINCAALQKAVGGSDFLTPPAQAVDACVKQLGSSRVYYGTPDTVEDIELLRQLLKADKLTLNGTSYGSYTAAQYGLKYPKHVRSLVLDSVVPHKGFDPLGIDLMNKIGEVLIAACRRSCGTDPAADLAWLIQNSQVDGPRILEMLAVLSLNSFNPSLDGVPEAIHEAGNGTTAALEKLLNEATSRNLQYDQLSAGLHLATFCTDLPLPRDLNAALRRLNPYPFDHATVRNQLSVAACTRWPAGRRPTYPPATRVLQPRTLIVHGANDLFCPVEWAEWQKAHSRDATLLVVPGNGHSVQSHPSDSTGREKVREFLLG